jgi:predicted dehydrogenase
MIRLLCAGLGGMGLHDWSSAAKVKDFRLVGGVDVNAAARKSFEEKTGAPTFDSFETALRDVAADAALVATPDAFHAPYSIRAMEAGLDVICEKPMAETLEDARRMHAAAERSGRMLMLHQQLPWTAVHRSLKSLVDDGVLGRISHVEFDMYVFSDVCLSGYRSRLPQLMLQDLAIHHFDLIRYLTGQDCERLFVRSWKSNEEDKAVLAPTNVYGILEMRGGIRACYRSKIREMLDPTGYLARVELTGSRGSATLTGDKIRTQTFAGFALKETPREIVPAEPTTGIWEDFAEAIRTRKPMWTSSGNNLKSLAMIFAAIRSVETGTVVELDNA